MRVAREVEGGALNIPKVLWVDTLKSNQNLVVVDRLADEAIGIWKLLRKRKKVDDSTKIANTQDKDEFEYDFSDLEKEIELVYLNYTFNGFAKENSDDNLWITNKDELLNAIRMNLFERRKDQWLMQIREGVKKSEKFIEKIKEKALKSNDNVLDENVKKEIQAIYLNDMHKWATDNIEKVFKNDCKYHIPKVVPTMIQKVLAEFDKTIIIEDNNDLVWFFKFSGRVTHGKISYNNYAFAGRFNHWHLDFKEVTFDWKERDVNMRSEVVWPKEVEYRVVNFESSIYGNNCRLKDDIKFIEGGFKVDFTKEEARFRNDYANKYEEKELYHNYTFLCGASRENLRAAGFTPMEIAKMPRRVNWSPGYTPINE